MVIHAANVYTNNLLNIKEKEAIHEVLFRVHQIGVIIHEMKINYFWHSAQHRLSLHQNFSFKMIWIWQKQDISDK